MFLSPDYVRHTAPSGNGKSFMPTTFVKCSFVNFRITKHCLNVFSAILVRRETTVHQYDGIWILQQESETIDFLTVSVSDSYPQKDYMTPQPY